MTEHAYRRRGLLRGATLATAGAAGGFLAGTGISGAGTEMTAQAEPTGSGGPWLYLAPGRSIADAVDRGARAIQLGEGEYRIDRPVVLPHGSYLRGVGQLTRLRAVQEIPTVLAIGNGGPAYGVQLADLAIDCADTARTGVELNIVGQEGNFNNDNDAVCRLENLLVWAPTEDGVVYRGTDNRAVLSTRVRVRQAGRHGFLIGDNSDFTVSDCWWIACEATTARHTDDSAGFEVRGANHFFQACKAWYCRDYGFHVNGVRNKFTGCETQDTRLSGWYVEFDMNTFTGCTADTAGMWDVGGTRDTADGFYVEEGEATSMVGCQAFDRAPRGHREQQRYGFNVPGSMIEDGRLIGHSGWGNTRGLVRRR